MNTASDPDERLWLRARSLALFTVFYNLAEGLVSVWFGIEDEALTLFGFGADSFIEVISGVGVLAMVERIRHHPGESRSRFERSALRVTGTSFFLLTAALVATAAYNLVSDHHPQTTLPGLIVSLVSITVMWALVLEKRRVGRALASPPILADANCTRVCVWMSLVLLAASAVYQLTGFGFSDSLGTAGLAWFSFSEGRESFEKASGLECECGKRE